jgi:hypothetical protein
VPFFFPGELNRSVVIPQARISHRRGPLQRAFLFYFELTGNLHPAAAADNAKVGQPLLAVLWRLSITLQTTRVRLLTRRVFSLGEGGRCHCALPGRTHRGQPRVAVLQRRPEGCFDFVIFHDFVVKRGPYLLLRTVGCVWQTAQRC